MNFFYARRKEKVIKLQPHRNTYNDTVGGWLSILGSLDWSLLPFISLNQRLTHNIDKIQNIILPVVEENKELPLQN